MDAVANELQEKGFKGFASLSQIKRCDSLVEAGTIALGIFERDLLATEIESIPWRKGPAKPTDGTQEEQEDYRNKMIQHRAELVEKFNQSGPESILKPTSVGT